MATFSSYVIWIFFFVIGIPFAFKLVELNNALGFKFATAKHDPAIWKRVNSFAGWCIIIFSVIGSLLTYLGFNMAEQWGAIFFIGFLMLTVIATFIYMKIIA